MSTYLDLLTMARTAQRRPLTPEAFPAAVRGCLSFSRAIAPFTTFKIGGPAEAFAQPTTADEAVEVVRAAQAFDAPVNVLGCGSNLLVSDRGMQGLVLSLRKMKGFRVVPPSGRAPADLPIGAPVRVVVEAGASLEYLVKHTARLGLRGLEFLAGIPATVGGALAMNAGTKYGEIASALDRLVFLSPCGTLETLRRDEIMFLYRRSSLVAGVVLQATFRLTKDDPSMLMAEREEYLRSKLASQPWSEPSAGCVFKNHPKPTHPTGLMIEKAGCKGMTEGGAAVSQVHANFITNPGRAASARDVLRLIERVRSEVQRHFFVDLDLEVKLWGEAA